MTEKKKRKKQRRRKSKNQLPAMTEDETDDTNAAGDTSGETARDRGKASVRSHKQGTRACYVRMHLCANFSFISPLFSL